MKSLRTFLIISLLVLAGCASRQKVQAIPDAEIITKWRTFDCGTPPETDFINLTVPRWRIIDGRYTLTPEEYANLGESVSDIIKAARQMSEVIDFYQKCIASAQNKEPSNVE